MITQAENKCMQRYNSMLRDIAYDKEKWLAEQMRVVLGDVLFNAVKYRPYFKLFVVRKFRFERVVYNNREELWVNGQKKSTFIVQFHSIACQPALT